MHTRFQGPQQLLQLSPPNKLQQLLLPSALGTLAARRALCQWLARLACSVDRQALLRTVRRRCLALHPLRVCLAQALHQALDRAPHLPLASALAPLAQSRLHSLQRQQRRNRSVTLLAVFF